MSGAVRELVDAIAADIEADTERRRALGVKLPGVVRVVELVRAFAAVEYCAPDCWCEDCDWSHGTSWNGVRWMSELTLTKTQAQAAAREREQERESSKP